MKFTEDQIKDLVPVQWEDLCTFIERNEKAYLYYNKIGDWHLMVIEHDQFWESEKIKLAIDKGILFRRRNKPFKTFLQ
jgi:hypothetical protein